MLCGMSSRGSSAPIRSFRPVGVGDRVAVVAPASPVKLEMLAMGTDDASRLGYKPQTRPDITARWRFTAGSDARRLDELRWALRDPSLRAVWLARGGYGITPLLRHLDPAELVADPKPIIGESDATALGCWALCAGVAWLHGPMVATQLRGGGDGYDEASLRSALAGEPYRLKGADVSVLAGGRAEGTLWGGCLTLLAALCGTPWLPRVERGVLVVEDVGVKPYQVHRMLVQLEDAGALEGLAGVILGDFSGCVQHENQGYDVRDVLADFFRDVAGDVPVTAGWPIGHAPAPHVTLAMGWHAVLATGNENGNGVATLDLSPPS